MPFPPFRTPGDRAAALAFFAGRDAAHGLFHRVVSTVAEAGPFELAATRSRVACVARTRFLWVHEANEDGAIWLGFLLPHPLSSDRVRSGRLGGGRWSHHVKVASEADLDGELVGWLREAYEADVAGIEDAPAKAPKAPKAAKKAAKKATGKASTPPKAAKRKAATAKAAKARR